MMKLTIPNTSIQRKESIPMKRTKQLLASALALVMALSALTACGGGSSSSSSAAGSSSSSSAGSTGSEVEAMDLTGVTDPYLATSGLAGDTVVAKVGDVDITAAELLYWINYGTELTLSQYGGYMTELPWDNDLGDGMTLADQMKQSALDAAALYALLPTLAQQEGLSVTQETLDQLESQHEQAVQTLGSEEAAERSFWYQMITWDLLTQLSTRADLHLQLQNLYYGEGSENYPTDAEVLAYAQDELGVYRAKHILLATVDTETRESLDEATVAEKKATAEDLLAQLRAAEDPVALFDELMNEYSEDPGLATNPDGYTAYKGQMVPEFESAALALKDGEISDVVYSESTGYHIILRLPLDPANYRNQLVAQLMQVKTDEWLEEYGVETTPAYDQIDPASFREKVVSLQAAVQEEVNAILAAQEDDGSGASSSAASSSSASSSASSQAD